ncbi:hypothetical protein KVT40_002944 [Elsinoe batatas]|uniref:Uncharacterized protein n=1 Tax=Elsinoe batatas TaxID=2601811 RepID=A0A8K0L5X3_9PEZI|nr:hypothetical protein KVT40_002944 [Elsinoe batatas]
MHASLITSALLSSLLLLSAQAAPAAGPDALAAPRPEGAFGSCFASLLLITDCARQAERFSTDVSLQNEEAAQCILDNVVAETRAQRIGKTYVLDFARAVTAADDAQGSILLFNKPAANVQPLPFSTGLFNEQGQPGGNLVTSLKFWRRNGYVAIVPGILTRPYEEILADIFQFVPALPNPSSVQVRRQIRLRYGRYGLSTRGLTCK